MSLSQDIRVSETSGYHTTGQESIIAVITFAARALKIDVTIDDKHWDGIRFLLPDM